MRLFREETSGEKGGKGDMKGYHATVSSSSYAGAYGTHG